MKIRRQLSGFVCSALPGNISKQRRRGNRLKLRLNCSTLKPDKKYCRSPIVLIFIPTKRKADALFYRFTGYEPPSICPAGIHMRPFAVTSLAAEVFTHHNRRTRGRCTESGSCCFYFESISHSGSRKVPPITSRLSPLTSFTVISNTIGL